MLLRSLALILCFLTVLNVQAQPETVATLQARAKTFIQSGDFDNA
ncbi:MAG: hypothetical protein RIQ34_1433, partial [Bacteroidota bacterium]